MYDLLNKLAILEAAVCGAAYSLEEYELKSEVSKGLAESFSEFKDKFKEEIKQLEDAA